MKFVLIFGPQAVGKMTVGQELEKKTNLKLFHNHMTIELLEPYFGFSSEMWKLSDLFRWELFKAVSDSQQEGLIFTYVWAFDQKRDWDYVESICELFESKGATIYFVELASEIEERLKRNKSSNRLEQKPTKRNVDLSEKELKATIKTHRLNSFEGEIKREHYIKLTNTTLSANEAAEIIKVRFNL